MDNIHSFEIKPPPDPKHYYRVSLYGLAFIFIIIIAGGIGYLLAMGNIQRQTTLLNIQSSYPVITPSVRPIDKQSGWNVYNDENYNFSIQYPATYQVTPSKVTGNFNGSAKIIGKLRIDITRDVNPDNIPVKTWVNNKLAAWKKGFEECNNDPKSLYCGDGPHKVIQEKFITIANTQSLYQETVGAQLEIVHKYIFPIIK